MEKSSVVINNATTGNQTATINQLYHYTVRKCAFAKSIPYIYIYIHCVYYIFIYIRHIYIYTEHTTDVDRSDMFITPINFLQKQRRHAELQSFESLHPVPIEQPKVDRVLQLKHVNGG